MILLDTSVLIEILKDQDKASSVINKLPDDDLALSVVTIAEIELGFNFLPTRRNKEKRERFLEFIKTPETRIIPVYVEIARTYARLQAQLMKKGKTLSRFDALIAATAIEMKITLFTTDADFDRVEGIRVKILE